VLCCKEAIASGGIVIRAAKTGKRGGMRRLKDFFLVSTVFLTNKRRQRGKFASYVESSPHGPVYNYDMHVIYSKHLDIM
jgi:hypothetical protein